MTKDEMQSAIEAELGRIAGTGGDLSDATCRSYARVIRRQIDSSEEAYTEYLEALKVIPDGSSTLGFADAYNKAIDIAEDKGIGRAEPDGTEPMTGV